MATIPSLALIPSGYKASKVYSVLPTDGTGDFTFTRSGNATRVNSEGLIELVTTNVPRLNYPLIDGVVNGCPSLLLEPSRTNLITYSEDFTNSSWEKTRSSIVSNNAISPDGTQNADKLIEDTTASNTHQNQHNVTVGNVPVTISIFIKADTRSRIRVQLSDLTTGDYRIDLNLNTGSVLENNGGSRGSWTNTSYKIENFQNNWYKISLTATKGAGTIASLILELLDDYGNVSYTGDGTSGLYIWGAQLEAGSYPTSYIPNYGTALGVTRSAETCKNAGDVNTFNDSEGVLMLEASALADDGTGRSVSIFQNGSNFIKFQYFTSSNRVDFVAFSAGAVSCNITEVITNTTDNNKFALKWKLNDFALWINGVEVGTDTSGNAPIGMDKISFTNESGSSGNFYGNTKQIQYFPTALNDSDLETLTSWDSFSDMAISLLYTIE